MIRAPSHDTSDKLHSRSIAISVFLLFLISQELQGPMHTSRLDCKHVEASRDWFLEPGGWLYAWHAVEVPFVPYSYFFLLRNYLILSSYPRTICGAPTGRW